VTWRKASKWQRCAGIRRRATTPRGAPSRRPAAATTSRPERFGVARDTKSLAGLSAAAIKILARCRRLSTTAVACSGSRDEAWNALCCRRDGAQARYHAASRRPAARRSREASAAAS
jgi:hypothetical protein